MDKLQKEKLKMWQDKLLKMEEEYQDILIRKGEAASMGDLRENGAYQMLTEDAEKWRVKMDEVKKIIEVIKNGSKN